MLMETSIYFQEEKKLKQIRFVSYRFFYVSVRNLNRFIDLLQSHAWDTHIYIGSGSRNA